ncbi:phage protease [Methylophaga nitratireducenticrescens]|uniref:phage protease n=1 Tax=Methylophaga nitratireducenticrescens TaxID=754476 RepID=UPI000CDC7D5B|nr:phage protease [Methylophaga nitratireducenticrescens]AUZ85856.1 hypothetical protein CDW43_15345 [Methylophaga nitratireducenticrescens]
MNKTTSLSAHIAIAVCSSAPLDGNSLQLMPDGKFSAPRGSMLGLTGPWFIDDRIAAAAIARIRQYDNDIVIDYEHQTLKSAENGKPAPAAGWIKRDQIKWVAGKGLIATNVEWTAEAKAFIESGQYKYLSPVFAFNKSTGHVLDIRQVALTNDAAIDGMDEVLAAATAKFLPHHQQEENPMNPALLKLLGLDKAATEDEVIAACKALQTDKVTLEQQLADKDTALAAATAATPETATAVIKEQGEQIAALKARLDGNDVDTLIAAAKAEGKVTPAQEKWLENQPVDVVKSFVEAAAPIAALTQQQIDGKTNQFDKDGKAVLTEQQVAVCTSMGISQEDYVKQLEQEVK